MKSSEIRQKFFEYFVRNGHTKVASSSLIPADDPTLLFANAGMNQFKDIFLGQETRSYTRAVTIQKCMRAGGKHNDLENVGFTARHLTFFEMLGNFSFGDYFKEGAITFAWEFLTKELTFNPEQLWVSIYHEDNEAYAIWHEKIGLPAERIVKLGRQDNFWQMGDTGPCGPCSEIYVDRGAKTEAEKDLKPGDECERFLEIWNLVFMQFGRQKDGAELPLKKTGIDTGMGLERLCAVLQNTPTVFETDLFAPLVLEIERLSGRSYSTADHETKTAFRVLLDHIRSTSLAIADGGMPSNEGRGYVIRKIIRRAALFAQKLGDITLFEKLVPTLAKEMGHIYPELRTNEQMIRATIASELEKFAQNLTQGQSVINRYMAESAQSKKLTGEQAFKLYDTYGFPLELTRLVAREKGYTVDEAGFDQAMLKQQEQSGKKREDAEKISLPAHIQTSFVGDEQLKTTATVTALLLDNKPVESIETDASCLLITDKTPFYVEAGGQMSDRGIVVINGAPAPIRAVKKIGPAIALALTAPAKLTIGMQVNLEVDVESRRDAARNHTATHLLQAALMAVLGPHVKQSGSLVTSEYARFDFTHAHALTEEEVEAVEAVVNEKIRENIELTITTTSYKRAVEQGAIAFFGEKYNPESVRVVSIPGFSTELCGGSHVHATGDIGTFKITAVSSPAAGIRRIMLVTGRAATVLFSKTYEQIQQLGQLFKVRHDQVIAAIEKQQEQLHELSRQLTTAKHEALRYRIPGWLNQTEELRGLPFGYIALDGLTAKELRELGQELTDQKPGFYFIASSGEGKATSFIAIIAATLADRVDLKAFATWLSTQGLRGGVNGNVVQGGGTTMPEGFAQKIVSWLKES
ncbi:MAG: alanine--tRNA ligase [Candidatus Dependentiae bacterium]|nr:alanine--tRNA ligase [Candidatus Dependentiae bacterium]